MLTTTRVRPASSATAASSSTSTVTSGHSRAAAGSGAYVDQPTGGATGQSDPHPAGAWSREPLGGQPSHEPGGADEDEVEVTLIWVLTDATLRDPEPADALRSRLKHGLQDGRQWVLGARGLRL